MLLITAFHSPGESLTRDNTEILDCPLSDGDLEALINTFSRDEQRIQYAVACQFNFGAKAIHDDYQAKIIFGDIESKAEERFLEEMRTSRRALRPGHTVASLFLNNPEASEDEIRAANVRVSDIEA